MNKYAVSLVAIRNSPTGINLRHQIYYWDARNKHQAEVMALDWFLQEVAPPGDGWIGHDALAVEMP